MYPHANFSHGISNLKLLTAMEWAGVVFALSLIVCTAWSFKLFENLFKWQGNKAQHSMEEHLDNGMHFHFVPGFFQHHSKLDTCILQKFR